MSETQVFNRVACHFCEVKDATIATLTAERDNFCERLNEIDGGIYDTMRISEEQWRKKAHDLTEQNNALRVEIVGTRNALQEEIRQLIVALTSTEREQDALLEQFSVLETQRDSAKQERDALRSALQQIAGYGKNGICPYGCDAPNVAAVALRRE